MSSSSLHQRKGKRKKKRGRKEEEENWGQCTASAVQHTGAGMAMGVDLHVGLDKHVAETQSVRPFAGLTIVGEPVFRLVNRSENIIRVACAFEAKGVRCTHANHTKRGDGCTQ